MSREPNDSSDSFGSLFEATDSISSRQSRLHPGMQLDVVVSRVGNSAVFADIDAKSEAFIDLHDLVDPAGQPMSVEVGTHLRVRVVEIGGKAGAIRLSPIAMQTRDAESAQSGPDMKVFAGSEKQLVAGATVKVTVSRIESWGVFVQIAEIPGREGRGLIPSQETGLARGADLRKHFTAGQALEAKILSVEDGRVRLSVRALATDEEHKQFENFQQQTQKPDRDRPVRGFGTLGDLLKNVKPAAQPKKSSR